MSNWAMHATGPLSSQNGTVTKVLTRSFATKTATKVKTASAVKDNEVVTKKSKPLNKKDAIKQDLPKFKGSPAEYIPFDKEDSTYALSSKIEGRVKFNNEIKALINADILGVRDPAFLEEIESREKVARQVDSDKMKVVRKIISDKNADKAPQKIRKLIELKAPSDVIFNTMYNRLPRTAALGKRRENIDSLDWQGSYRKHFTDEVDLNGYDMEDSSDPDTLPRQRAFTVDEMNRILQDVEESHAIESDIEELLFQPVDLVQDLRNASDRMELRRKWKDFVKVAPRSSRLHQMNLNDFLNYKAPKLAKDEVKEEAAVDGGLAEQHVAAITKAYIEEVSDVSTIKAPKNKLHDLVMQDAQEWTRQRNDTLGTPFLTGFNSGAQTIEDVVKHQFVSNSGAGLIPSAIDFSTLPFERERQLEDFTKQHDPKLDFNYPFALRVDEVMLGYLKDLETSKRIENKDPITLDVIFDKESLKNLPDVKAKYANHPTKKEALAGLPLESPEYTEAEMLFGIDDLESPIHRIRDINSFLTTNEEGERDYNIRDDLIKDKPELALALKRFLAGSFDNRLPQFMRSKSKSEQYAILEPLFTFWNMTYNEHLKMLPVKKGQFVDGTGSIVDELPIDQYNPLSSIAEQYITGHIDEFNPFANEIELLGGGNDVDAEDSMNDLEKDAAKLLNNEKFVDEVIASTQGDMKVEFKFDETDPDEKLLKDDADIKFDLDEVFETEEFEKKTLTNLQQHVISHPEIYTETYRRLTGLFEEDNDAPEAVKLRSQLSTGLYDPINKYRNVPDVYFEDFTSENTVVIPEHDLRPLADYIASNDPYRNYFDKLPEDLKRFEYTIDVNVDYEGFIRKNASSEKVEKKYLIKQNNIQYNNVISKKALKKLRHGLDKYSGVPQHLLNFLEVFLNKRDNTYDGSNRDTIQFRRVLELERLSQKAPDNVLADGRPDDSTFENPDISIPIMLDGPTTTTGARKIQENYKKHLKTDPVEARLMRYKAALLTRQGDNSIDYEDVSDNDLPRLEHDNSEMEEEFVRIRDRIISEAMNNEYDEHDDPFPLMQDSYAHGMRLIAKHVTALTPAQRLDFINQGTLPEDFLNEDMDASLLEQLGLGNGVANENAQIRANILKHLSDPKMMSKTRNALFKGAHLRDRQVLSDLAEDEDFVLRKLGSYIDEDAVDVVEEASLSDLDMDADSVRDIAAKEEDEVIIDEDGNTKVVAKEEGEELEEARDEDLYDEDDISPRDEIADEDGDRVRPRDPVKHAALKEAKERAEKDATELVSQYEKLIHEGTVRAPIVINDSDFHKQPILKISLDDVSNEPLNGEEINVAALLVRERQMIRDVANKLQIHKKSDRAALRRIYSISPEYARELVQRAANIANGILPDHLVPHNNVALTPIIGINWQQELNILEDSVFAQSVKMNARTGGAFPGVPGVNRTDVTHYNPPDLIAGEFAPLFVESNLISSSDEVQDPTYLLPGFANATFPFIGTTELGVATRAYQPTEQGVFGHVRDLRQDVDDEKRLDTENGINVDPNVDPNDKSLFSKTLLAATGKSNAKPVDTNDKSYVETDLPLDIVLWLKNNAFTQGRKFFELYRHMVCETLSNEAEIKGKHEFVAKDDEEVEILKEDLYVRVNRFTLALVEFINNPNLATRNEVEFRRKYISLPEHLALESVTFKNLYRSCFYNQQLMLVNTEGNLVEYDVEQLQTVLNNIAKGDIGVNTRGVFAENVARVEHLKSSLKDAANDLVEQCSVKNDKNMLINGYMFKGEFIPVSYVSGEAQVVEEKVSTTEELESKRLKETLSFDPIVMGASGYPTSTPHTTVKRIDADPYGYEHMGHVLETYKPFTDDPMYNFMEYNTTVEGKKRLSKEDSVWTKMMFNGIYNKSRNTNLGSIGSDISYKRSTVQDLDRPEEEDLTRRLVDPTVTLSDVMSIREYKSLQTIYDLRMAKNFFEGRLSPGEAAYMRNNYRLNDVSYGLDTISDEESDIARIQKEVVVGVVREWIEDHDINSYQQEFDAHNVEPDYDPFYQHEDLINAFAARRISPYSTMPLGESNIPPIIGLETQKHVYTLHLLDPATFHPRWIARRLNMTYPAAVTMLKVQDMMHKRWTEETTAITDGKEENDFTARPPRTEEEEDILFLSGEAPQIQEHLAVGGLGNVEFNADINLPHPIEVTLSNEDTESLFARFAPSLIGRITWTKHKEADCGDFAWRHYQSPHVTLLGDEGLHKMYHYEQMMNKRWASKTQILDAMEKSAFAKWGAIQWGGSKMRLQRPPKIPREIVSTTLHPPTRHNWMLTLLDEEKDNTYGICVRDRDGYLRHPTYTEFMKVRLREKDRRMPFFWRKHHVLGRIPDITNLFIDQVHAVRKQTNEQYNLLNSTGRDFTKHDVMTTLLLNSDCPPGSFTDDERPKAYLGIPYTEDNKDSDYDELSEESS